MDKLRTHIDIQHNKKIAENISGVVCDECNTVFRSVKSLKDHKRKIHGAKKHECPHCQKKFYYASDLKGHVKSVHSNKW
ncbi:hypothetical protein GCK72_011119 [Caenorhabditis remanei]|uniref:C2H2-type domain-containing protein n=1 Tax=Caenorhabditis remanei TaxID=31234 RepID=A0A6A5H7L4_CAERE|nr:hypothetical protein GCK72_011119 [Caenorhabditis remanei]KAF1762856.1 hypothetical protein GCK72_011119 [Caenorhabditis remanei]